MVGLDKLLVLASSIIIVGIIVDSLVGSMRWALLRLMILGYVCDWTDKNVRPQMGGVCDTQ